MKILYIAPMPPPITGHSLASEVLYDELEKRHEVVVVNLSKDSFKSGIDSFARIRDVIGILRQIYQKKKNVRIIYLTISESFAGNLKDLLIYLLCFSKLSKFYIHLHGGSIQKLLFERNRIMYALNRFFLRRLRGIIVLGRSHIQIFDSFVDINKIHVVPNFAQDFIFLDEKLIPNKFAQSKRKIIVLFLSNMQIEKGYLPIAEAYKSLSPKYKDKFEIHFAGKFDLSEEEVSFKSLIKDESGITYHGIVQGDEKKKLLHNAHVLFLPTSFLEGQPVAILEAYAAGCVVFTTLNGGIPDIFTPGKHGFQIEQNCQSIVQSLLELADQKINLEAIAINNRKEAISKYRTELYNQALINILEQGECCNIFK